MDTEYIRGIYSKMSDAELVRVITQNAKGLTPQAVDIIYEELEKRGLDKDIGRAIELQNQTHTTEDVVKYCDILSMVDCPRCGGASERLSATVAATAISAIIFTNYDKRIKVGCKDCLDKVNTRAALLSLLFGWWGLPWGFIRTPQALWTNWQSLQSHKKDGHNEYMMSFAAHFIGEIEVYKNNREKLKEIAARQL